MKTFIGIFIFLLSVCVIGNGQDVAVGMVENLLNALSGLFSRDKKNDEAVNAFMKSLRKDKETGKGLTTAEGLVRSLYDEKVSCRVARGILLKDYPTVIENFAKRFAIPVDIKDSLLNAQYSHTTENVALNFEFKKSGTGSYVYGRMETIKDGNKVDMAYCVYTLDFKLSDKVTKHRCKNKFLLRIVEGVCSETEEQNFSSKEQNVLRQYFAMKANSEFQTRGFTKNSQHCTEDRNCN